MNCVELEALLCDYQDGALSPGERAEVERHLTGCPACAELARDAEAAVAFMGRCAEVTPPPELLNKILFDLPPGRHAAERSSEGLAGAIRRWFQPVLQPRFVMGMAMTILSFSMLGRFANIPVRNFTADDLRPAKVWQAIDDRANRAWQRTVKFYESLRVVYEIQTRVRDWTEQDQQERRAAAAIRGEQPAQPAPAKKSAEGK